MGDRVSVPSFKGDAPVNYQHVRESFALAMDGEDISQETITDVIEMVDQAVVNNEMYLLWESDVPDNILSKPAKIPDSHENNS